MASKGKTIFQLNEKISVMIEAMCGLEDQGNSSLNEFARWCGVDPKTLRSACASGGLTKNLEGKIAERLGFELEHRTWVDPNVPLSSRHDGNYRGPRSDDALSFRNYLLPHLGLAGSVRYQLVTETPITPSAEMVSVELTDHGQTTAEGSDVHIHLQASLRVAYLEDGIAYGFDQFAVKLGLMAGDTHKVIARLGEDGNVQLPGAELICQGTPMQPVWVFKCPRSVFNNEVSTSGGDLPLVRILPRSIPAEMTVELSVHPHNGSLVVTPPHKMTSKNKERIVERLMLQMIGNLDPSGSLTLAKQKVTIVQVDDD
jgi:hypothetical protein